MQQSIAPSVGPRPDASAGQSRQSSSTGMQSINYQKKNGQGRQKYFELEKMCEHGKGTSKTTKQRIKITSRRRGFGSLHRSKVKAFDIPKNLHLITAPDRRLLVH